MEKLFNKIDEFNEIYQKNGMPILKGGVARGGSDAAYTTQCGIPTVDSIGISGGRIHSTEEFVYEKSLSEAAKRVAIIKEL